MRKIDLILENIRDEYMINLLEEGEVTELQTLKTKKFLNESLQAIRGMLVEEGTLDNVKGHLKNNWGKYLAGAGAAGLAGAGYANSDALQNAYDTYANGASPDASISDTRETFNFLNQDGNNPVEMTGDKAGSVAQLDGQNANSAATASEQDAILNGPTQAAAADTAAQIASQAATDQNIENITNQYREQALTPNVGQQITPNDLAGSANPALAGAGGTFTDRIVRM